MSGDSETTVRLRPCITHHHACDCREERFRQIEIDYLRAGRKMAELDVEIKRLRAALLEVVKATDVGAYFTARRAAGVAIGISPKP